MNMEYLLSFRVAFSIMASSIEIWFRQSWESGVNHCDKCLQQFFPKLPWFGWVSWKHLLRKLNQLPLNDDLLRRVSPNGPSQELPTKTIKQFCSTPRAAPFCWRWFFSPRIEGSLFWKKWCHKKRFLVEMFCSTFCCACCMLEKKGHIGIYSFHGVCPQPFLGTSPQFFPLGAQKKLPKNFVSKNFPAQRVALELNKESGTVFGAAGLAVVMFLKFGWFTLPKTNIARPLKMIVSNRYRLFAGVYFQGIC